MNDEHYTIRGAIAADIAARGVAPVARTLGVDRSTLATYMTGRSRAGTTLLIEVQASAAYGLDGTSEGSGR